MTIRRFLAGFTAAVIAACVFASDKLPLSERIATASAVSARYLKRVENVSAEMFSDGTAYVQWTSIPAADGYEVYVSEGQNGKYKKAAAADSAEYDFVSVKGLDPKKEYWFKVRAYKYSGGEKAYGGYSDSVKTVPELAEYLEEKAPLYSGFLKEMRTYPLYFSAERYNRSGRPEEKMVYAVFSPGENYMSFYRDGKTQTGILLGSRYYELFPEYKAGTLTRIGKSGAEKMKNIDSRGNLFIFDIDRGGAKFRSGTKDHNGKKYLYDEIKTGSVTLTFYADRKTREIQSFEMSDGSAVTYKITALHHKPDKSLLNIPKSYDIADISAYN